MHQDDVLYYPITLMFRWIFSVVGLFTATRSYGVAVCGVWIILLYYTIKKQYKTLLRFLIGAIFACFSLWHTHYLYEALQKISLDGVIEWVVINQRSSTTRVVQTDEQQLLLQSKKQLTPWQSILFSAQFTHATLPQSSWWNITPSWFFGSWFSFDNWLFMKQYGARWTTTPQKIVVLDKPPVRFSVFDRFHYQFKEYVQQTIQNNHTRSLLIWMTIWDRSWFTKEEYTMFVESWLVHILAVSGSNVVYLSLFLSAVLFRLPFYARSLLIWIALVIYWLLCGADSSVIRAISMWLIWLLATLSWRNIPIWTILKITAGFMLLRNPLLLWYDLWFILSFSAVLWILIIWRRSTIFYPHRQYSFFSKQVVWLFIPLLWATLGVQVILIPLNQYFSVTWILINCVVVPLVPVFLVVSWLFLVSSRSVCEAIITMLSSWLFTVAWFIVNSWLTVNFNSRVFVFLCVGLSVCFLIWIHYSTSTKERSVSG